MKLITLTIFLFLVATLTSCGKKETETIKPEYTTITKTCLPKGQHYGAICKMKYGRDEACFYRHTPINRPASCRVYKCVERGYQNCRTGPY